MRISGRNEIVIQKNYDLARTFILITSAPEIPALNILRDYKDQY